jgi:hypothetical protein
VVKLGGKWVVTDTPSFPNQGATMIRSMSDLDLVIGREALTQRLSIAREALAASDRHEQDFSSFAKGMLLGKILQLEELILDLHGTVAFLEILDATKPEVRR